MAWCKALPGSLNGPWGLYCHPCKAKWLLWLQMSGQRMDGRGAGQSLAWVEGNGRTQQLHTFPTAPQEVQKELNLG